MAHRFLPTHGGYEKLFSFQKATIIYDATVYFTSRFFSKGDRTIDQMVQAARSGKQNIAEASLASATSKETELKLTNVARASQVELLIDYQDFLRKNKLLEWPIDHPYTKRLKTLHHTLNPTYETYKKGIEHNDPEICANVIIGLIRVTCYLLTRQIQSLEEDFLKNGGIKERMTTARLSARGKNPYRK